MCGVLDRTGPPNFQGPQDLNGSSVLIGFLLVKLMKMYSKTQDTMILIITKLKSSGFKLFER